MTGQQQRSDGSEPRAGRGPSGARAQPHDGSTARSNQGSTHHTSPPRSTGDSAGSPSEAIGLQSFGRYHIVRALGRGAMGTVYLAEDTVLRRQVALKTPHFDDDPTGELLARFKREAQSAAGLRHENICPVYDIGQVDGKQFISMAYIEGEPLSAVIQRRATNSERQILLLVRKLAKALQEAHSHGVVHRDLKPANIMITSAGEPMIMDFGLARRASQQEGDIRLTKSGIMLGSPAYMSPEQVDADWEAIGPATDQYSLGVILYEMLTCQLPFSGSIASVMAQILTKKPAAPATLRPDLDGRIETLCLKMMAKKPSERYASLAVVADQIVTIVKNPGSKTTSLPTSAAEKSPVERIVEKPSRRTESAAAVDTGRFSDRPTDDAMELVGEPPISHTADRNSPRYQRPLATSRRSSTAGTRQTERQQPNHPAWIPWLAGVCGIVAVATFVWLILSFFGSDNEPKPDGPAGAIAQQSPSQENSAPAPTPAPPKQPAASNTSNSPDVSTPENAETPRAPVLPTLSRPELLTAPFGVVAARQSQNAWSKYLRESMEMSNSVGMKMVLIPAGEFMMGSTEQELRPIILSVPEGSRANFGANQRPQHRVRITRPYFIGAHEVTRGQFDRFLRETGYKTEAETDGKGGAILEEGTGFLKVSKDVNWKNPGFTQSDNHPVVMVSWNDAIAFCEWLARKEKKVYRLPTEAEWEFVCRAGNSTAFANGSDPSKLVEVANVLDAAWKEKYPRPPAVTIRDGFAYTSPVGTFPSNAFGVFDMHGNVWEWCQDWYKNDYYANSPSADPTGPLTGSKRVSRGGAFDCPGKYSLAASRDSGIPSDRFANAGFRVVAEIAN